MEFDKEKFKTICVDRGHQNYKVEYIPVKHNRCADCGAMEQAKFKNNELQKLDEELN